MYLFLYHLHILLQFLPFCFAFPLFCPLFFIFKVVFTNFCHYFLPFVLHLSASSSFNLSLFTSLPLDLPSCCIVSSLSRSLCLLMHSGVIFLRDVPQLLLFLPVCCLAMGFIIFIVALLPVYFLPVCCLFISACGFFLSRCLSTLFVSSMLSFFLL